VLLWGGWLIVSGLVFSLSSGIIHTYYTVALAPAIAALVAIGGRMLWDRRDVWSARLVTIVSVLVTAGWSWVLLERAPSWNPWLRVLVAGAAVACAGGLLVMWAARGGSAARGRGRGRMFSALAVLGAIACLGGPVAYAADTISTARTGTVPSAGPSGGSAFAGGGLRPGSGTGSGTPPGGSGSGSGSGSRPVFRSGAGASAGTFGPSSGSTSSGEAPAASGGTGLARGAAAGGGTAGGAAAGGRGPAGGDGATSVSSALRAALSANASSYRWVAATSGSQSAASLELATGEPVMAIGGFSGEGGNLTLAQFERYVKNGKIHYYIASGGGPGGGQSGTSSIASWVESHYAKVTIGGQTLYDLTKPAS
jgi:4-amino-4-deoxy-L-arabinose transferase-like glycosyltransferase